MFLRRFVGTNCHTVVLPEHTDDVLPTLQHRVHQPVATLLRPITVASEQPTLIGNSLHKPFMTFLCRRRAFQSFDFQDKSLAFLPDNVFAYHAAHHLVVGSHEGRIFVRVGLAVEENHGNSLVVGSVDG